MTETHFSLLYLDGPTKKDLCLSPVLLWPVGLSSLLSCEWGNKIVLPSAVSFAFCSFFPLFFLSTEESSVVLLCMYCWPACKVPSSIRLLVRLFYDCTLSGKALSTGKDNRSTPSQFPIPTRKGWIVRRGTSSSFGTTF